MLFSTATPTRLSNITVERGWPTAGFARFHANHARRQIGEAFAQLAARDGLFQRYLAMDIHAGHTEYVLGQVDPYGSNISRAV